jgi:hypothetical protein
MTLKMVQSIYEKKPRESNEKLMKWGWQANEKPMK